MPPKPTHRGCIFKCFLCVGKNSFLHEGNFPFLYFVVLVAGLGGSGFCNTYFSRHSSSFVQFLIWEYHWKPLSKTTIFVQELSPTDPCRESFKASTNQWQLILISVEIAAVCPNSNWRVLLETSWHGVEALHIIPFEVPEVAAAFLLIRHYTMMLKIHRLVI